jgi:protein TonB
MANNVLLPPEIDPNPTARPPRVRQPLRPLDRVTLSADLGAAEQGVFSSLLSSIQDVFFPKKLPPLVLTSQPIAVVDRMAVKRDPTSVVISTVFNVAVIAFLLWFAARKAGLISPPKTTQIVTLDAPPVKLPPKAVTMGGGGGQKGPTPVTKGNPPKFAPQQLNPPKIAVDDAKLHPPVTVNVQQDIKMAKSDVPQFGMPNSPLVGMSMGNGNGTGLGSGNGNGIGPGSGGNMGGGLRRIGGGVSAPVVLFAPEPEFSEEARKAKVAGNVLVYLQVDANGHPTHVHVLRGIGLGLDEKAIEAVRLYKFKPAMENGKPVAVEMNVEVNFQIF